MAVFYHAQGTGLIESSISSYGFKYRLPEYPCEMCGVRGRFANHLVYPHLDPREVLSEKELALIKWKERMKDGDATTFRNLAAKLQNHFCVPVGPFTVFSPFKIRVAYKPKMDVEYLDYWLNDPFMRRETAEKLRNEGVGFDWVTPEASGSKAAALDLVQLLCPLAGYGSEPAGTTRCPACYRVTSPPTAAGRHQFVIYDSPDIRGLNLFRTINGGGCFYSAKFVETARHLGLSGFKDSVFYEDRRVFRGGQVFPYEAQPDPVADRVRICWPKSNLTVFVTTETATVAASANLLDSEFAAGWIARLERFLTEVKSRGGSATFERGSGLKGSRWPASLKTFLEACGGKIAFSFEDSDGSGGLTIDEGLISAHRKDCKEWATDTWIAEYPEDKEMWLKAIPLAALPTGDFLALDGRMKSDDPPVIYLNHEDSSEVVAPSLREFLVAWEKLGYVEPRAGDFL